MALAIQTRGLTKKYKNLTAVKQLDLDIPEGTIFGFLGPNGAGKTTTIRMLLGLIEPTAGEGSVLGHDIQKERSQIVKKIGAIVESPNMYNYLSGIDNLRVFARTSDYNVKDTFLYELLHQVGLNGREKHKVKTYSLGMKQRLGIAATLINNPQVIFLDEPTNGLDPAGTVEMREMILDLGKRGHTIFLSSHLLHEVEQLCSDVAIIQKGTTLAQGSVQQLLHQDSIFMIEAGPFERAMAVLSSQKELQATSQDNHWINVRAEIENIPQIIRKLVQADVDIYQVQAQKRSLESLFLELTGSAQDQLGYQVPEVNKKDLMGVA